MKSDNKELFSGKADVYAVNRPGYPEVLRKWLADNADLSAAADVGAGTGIFTAFLNPVCSKVTAIEPNDDMRRILQQELPQNECLNGSAENIPLPDHSLTLITAAQAFHWFDEELFRNECRRLLLPGGKVLIVWNNSADTPAAQAVKAVSRRFCPRFKSGHAGARTIEEGDKFLREKYFREVKVFSCPNPVIRNEEQFIGDQLSRSYALTPESPEFPEYLARLHRVFREFAVDGKLNDQYETTAYLGIL